MKTYYVEDWERNWMDCIEIGECIYVGDDYVKIISILKVDFSERAVWFTGILNEELNRTVLKQGE